MQSSRLKQIEIAVSVQYSRMRHLWRHFLFSGLCNIVVCTTYDFFQKPAITQKFKMSELDSFHSLKWHNILHCLSKDLYSESKITFIKLKIQNVVCTHWIFLSVQYSHMYCTFFDIVHTTILH